MRLRATHHALAPPILDDRLGSFCARPVEAIERSLWQVAIELRTIGRKLCLQSIEHLFGKAAGIFLRLHHQWRHRTDQRSLRYPAFAMPTQIMGDLTASGRMTNVYGVFQAKMRGQRCKIVGIVIHVVTVARLGGPAVAASIMGYDAIAVIEEEQHLRIPVIGRQRPTMTKDNRLSFAPVLVIDIDVSSVFFSYGYVWHSSFLCMFVDDPLSGRILSQLGIKCGFLIAQFQSSIVTIEELQAQVAQSRMSIGTTTKWPMILAVRFLDRQVINGGKPKSHQAIAIKFPVLVAIGTEPISRVVMPFIGEPHGDAVCVISPRLFDQPVVEFFGPLAFQKLNDFGSSSRELGAVSPA